MRRLQIVDAETGEIVRDYYRPTYSPKPRQTRRDEVLWAMVIVLILLALL